MIRDGIIRDLLKCANEISVTSIDEKRALLIEASLSIRWASNLISLSGIQVRETDIADGIDEFVTALEFRYNDETSDIMLEATGAIRLLRLMLGLKQERLDQSDQ
ncbi:hypothetical protein J2X72_001162 [Phyllobacterium sp. 1468]|nr:hypothetical protein [Phyllobacterium sp. 1468]